MITDAQRLRELARWFAAFAIECGAWARMDPAMAAAVVAMVLQ